jgi:hypothetical protein
MNNNPVFRRTQRDCNGEVIKDIWCITPVKRGVDEVRREGEEDRSASDTDVLDVGTVGQATNSGVRGSAVVVCSCKN